MINYEGISYNLETIIEFKSLKLLLEALAKKQIEHNILFYGQNNININKENITEKTENDNNTENFEKIWMDKINSSGLIKVFIESQKVLLDKNKEQDKIINELKDKIDLLEQNQNKMKEERLSKRISLRGKEKDINDIKDKAKEEEKKEVEDNNNNNNKDKAEREIIIINKDNDNKDNNTDDKINQNITIINKPQKEETILNEPISAESKIINIYDTKTQTKTKRESSSLNIDEFKNLEKQLLVLDEKINLLNEKLEEVEQITENNANDIDTNKNGIAELKKRVKKLEKIERASIQAPPNENNQEEVKQEEPIKNLDEDNEFLENKLNELENKIMKNLEQRLEEIEKNKPDIDLVKELNSIKEKLKEITDNIYVELNRIKKKNGEIENDLKNLMSLSEIKIINDKIKMLEQEMEDYATKNDIRRILGEMDKYEKELSKNSSILFEQKDINNKNRDEITKLTATLENLQQNFATLNHLLENNSLAKLIENLNMLSDTCVDKTQFEKQVQAINKKISELQMDVNENRRNLGEIIPKLENIGDINELKKMQSQIDDLMSKNNNEPNKSFNTEEIIKYIKAIESQVKLFMKKLDSEKEKERFSNENCILASRPVGGFKCASCETYIGDIKESNVFLPWNKYHGTERPYRLGSSFSRILQGLNIEQNYNPFLHQKSLMKNEKEKKYKIKNDSISVKKLSRMPFLNQISISEENSIKKYGLNENNLTSNKSIDENIKISEISELRITEGNKRKKKLNVNLWGIKSLKNLVNDKSVWTVNVFSGSKKRTNSSFEKDKIHKNNLGQKVIKITKKPRGHKINVSSDEKENHLVIPNL